MEARVTLSGAISDFQANAESMRVQVAARLGVPLAAVTLTALPGSVIVVITIDMERAIETDDAAVGGNTTGSAAGGTDDAASPDLSSLASTVAESLDDLLELEGSKGGGGGGLLPEGMAIVSIDVRSTVVTIVIAASPDAPPPMLLPPSDKATGFITSGVLIGVATVIVLIAFVWARRRNQEALAKKRRRKGLAGRESHKAPYSAAELSEACAFWFVKAKCLRESKEGRLLTLQEIRRDHPDWLEQRRVTFGDCCTGKLSQAVLAVSHRWEDKENPDPEGIQYAELMRYLKDRPGIELVWIDYSSMPQGKRTDEEKSEFKLMLPNINLIYLSAHVLIMMDSSYYSRFWTLFEAWLSMQSITSEGLRPSSEEGRRSKIICIHTGSEHDIAKLEDTLQGLTPREAHDLLAKSDITVTNASDKEAQLPKLLELDRFALAQFAAGQKVELALSISL